MGSLRDPISPIKNDFLVFDCKHFVFIGMCFVMTTLSETSVSTTKDKHKPFKIRLYKKPINANPLSPEQNPTGVLLLNLIKTISPKSLSTYSQWCRQLLERYPPKYNMNKFLYGGISEQLIKNLFLINDHQCQVLGDDHFFDDLLIDNQILLSVKTTKCHDNIVIVNYKTKKMTNDECIKLLHGKILLLVHFNHSKLYFIVFDQIIHSLDQFHQFFNSKDSHLSMKQSILDHVDPRLILMINVPKDIKENNAFNIYEILTDEIIKSCQQTYC